MKDIIKEAQKEIRRIREGGEGSGSWDGPGEPRFAKEVGGGTGKSYLPKATDLEDKIRMKRLLPKEGTAEWVKSANDRRLGDVFDNLDTAEKDTLSDVLSQGPKKREQTLKAYNRDVLSSSGMKLGRAMNYAFETKNEDFFKTVGVSFRKRYERT